MIGVLTCLGVSSCLVLHHAASPLFVQDAVTAFSAPNYISWLQGVFVAAVPASVGHTTVWCILLLLRLSWQHTACRSLCFEMQQKLSEQNHNKLDYLLHDHWRSTADFTGAW